MAFPLAPLLWLAIWLFLRNRKGGGGAGLELSPGASFCIWLVLGWAFSASFCFFFALLAFQENPLYIVLALAAFVVCFPWLSARWLLIPLGLVKTTYFVLCVPGAAMWKDRKGGACAGAAWALLRNRNKDPRLQSWLLARLESLHPLRGAGVAAYGLLEAVRGDREAARNLMGLLSSFDPKARPRRALRIAMEWLAAEAAARGDWEGVRDIGSMRRCRTRWTLFAGLAARRMLGESRPHPVLLWAAWLLAPQRVASLPLCRMALAAVPMPDSGEALREWRGCSERCAGRPSLVSSPAWRGGGCRAATGEGLLGGWGMESGSTGGGGQRGPLPPFGHPPPRHAGEGTRRSLACHAEIRFPESFVDVLQLHLRLASSDSVTLQRIDELQLAWSAVLEDEPPASLRNRAARLEAANTELVWEDAREAILDDLARLLRERRIPVSALTASAVSEELEIRAHDEAFEELEQAAEALARRKAEKQPLSMREELREWTALRVHYESVVTSSGAGTQPLAFSAMYAAACNHAVWLFNERQQRPLGNAMLRFLLAEAERAGDEEALRLQKANVAIPF